MLHDGMVERNRRALAEPAAMQSQKIHIALTLGQGGSTCVHDVRCEPLQFRQQLAGSGQENSAVPKGSFLGDITLGSDMVRLFDDRRHVEDLAIIEARPAPNVSVA